MAAEKMNSKEKSKFVFGYFYSYYVLGTVSLRKKLTALTASSILAMEPHPHSTTSVYLPPMDPPPNLL